MKKKVIITKGQMYKIKEEFKKIRKQREIIIQESIKEALGEKE